MNENERIVTKPNKTEEQTNTIKDQTRIMINELLNTQHYQIESTDERATPLMNSEQLSNQECGDTDNYDRDAGDGCADYVETTMNELLGWYGLPKIDKGDTPNVSLNGYPAHLSMTDQQSPPPMAAGALLCHKRKHLVPKSSPPDFDASTVNLRSEDCRRRSAVVPSSLPSPVSGEDKSGKHSNDTNNNNSSGSGGRTDDEEDDADLDDPHQLPVSDDTGDEMDNMRDSPSVRSDVSGMISPLGGKYETQRGWKRGKKLYSTSSHCTPARRNPSPLFPIGPTLDDIVPTLDDIAPTLDDIAPTLDDIVPTLDDIVPTLDDIVPTLDDIVPTLDNIVPTLDSIVPTLDDIVPTLDEFVPTLDDIVPTLDDFAPTLDDIVPTLDDIVPTLDDIVPTLDDIVPTLDDIVPTLDDIVPTLDDIVPTLEDIVPTLDDIVPTLDDIVPTLDDIVPTLDDIAPTLDDIAPTLDDIVPTLDDIAPNLDDIAPTLDDIAPTLDDIAPTLDDIVPTLDDIAPTLDDIAPTLANAQALISLL
ncbi:hypothetical protein BgiBS90_007434 [Biomphalaria glabrata]|nr:hypothetical protein BgiBS90_007434 [Biomphalaria glabrata]